MTLVTHRRIISDPAIMCGKPTIKGTRITVELILDELAGGMTPAEIREAHPHLDEEDIKAALAFAADYLRRDEIVFGMSDAAA